jgi:hypothetical protein
MSKSKRPYLLEIKKIKDNEKMIRNKKVFMKNKLSFSPLSGSELEYSPDLYNKNESIMQSHNCYSYAFGKIVSKLKNKAQPGYGSGYNHIGENEFNCESFRKRLKKDAPASYLEKFDNPCIPGFYKIFLALDPGNDYHWWRQDKNKYWSHKRGSSYVYNVDASNKKIKNPFLSDRKFERRNYHQPCFFACVYNDLARSIDFIYK